MSDSYQRLRDVSLFAGLSEEDLGRICGNVEDLHLEPGQMLFHEGDRGDRAYVITGGQVEIVKATARREVLLALRQAGEVIGEMALIQAEPRIAGARARTPVDLIAIPKSALDDLLTTSPGANRALFTTFLDRLKATSDRLRQSERMAQLGTLTAGVAHELNNPAAAVTRAAKRLANELEELTTRAAAPSATSTRQFALDLLGSRRPEPLDAVARSDAEADLEAWLHEHEVDEAWALAAGLVDAGISIHNLAALSDLSSGAELADALHTIVATSSIRRIADEIREGAQRISSIVGSLKSYSYLDQSPVQDVDIHRGLDDTLTLLAHKARNVQVVRDYAGDLPTITALGTELNQVWTNLIDNACDALEDLEGRNPTVILRTRGTDDSVVVEVEDNGPGIPQDQQAQIFDAFFTTKPPGKGTGFGLQISHRIVVLEHRGDLTVESEPGRTIFRVTLPIDQTVTTSVGLR